MSRDGTRGLQAPGSRRANLLYAPDRMRLPALAALLCLVEAAALFQRPAPPIVVAAPAPGALTRPEGDVDLRTMTADDLARGLWAMQRAGAPLRPDQLALVADAATLRREWEQLREDRRRAAAALAAAQPSCR